MRYLVRARLKPGKEQALVEAIDRGTLGKGSVAGGEYLRNMRDARLYDDGTARWVEVCYCAIPLDEERPYWEEFFDLVKVQDAHARTNCRDENGSRALGVRRVRLHRPARSPSCGERPAISTATPQFGDLMTTSGRRGKADNLLAAELSVNL